MELDKAIISRYSVKDYQSKDVDYKTIGDILDLARNAPSSGNVQNWRFIIVKDQGQKNRIANACLKQLWMNKAPVHIVVCFDERNIKSLFPKDHLEYSIQNTSIVSTLIMLKATDLKLGTCWVAVSNPREVSSILKLPDFIVPSVIITIGHSKDTYRKTRRHPIDTMTYFEAYDPAKRQIDTSIFPFAKHAKRLRKT